MGRFALCFGTAGAALLMLVAAGAPTTRAAPATRRATASQEPAGIVVSDCRVRLLNEVQLSSARTGILELAVAEGETVKSGTVVARLRDRLQRVGHSIAEREASTALRMTILRCTPR